MRASEHPDFNASGEGAVSKVWGTMAGIVSTEDYAMVGLYANFLMNTDPWRPSDAARAAIRKYEAMGPEAFRAYQAGLR